ETVYEIRLANNGKGPATGVQVRGVAPPGMLPRGAEAPASFRIEGQEIVFEPIPRLPPQAQTVFRVRVLAQGAGQNRFRVHLTCAQLAAPVVKEEGIWVYRD